MRTLINYLADAVKHKARLNHLYFIGTFLQTKFKNGVFVQFDSRYAEYSP